MNKVVTRMTDEDLAYARDRMEMTFGGTWEAWPFDGARKRTLRRVDDRCPYRFCTVYGYDSSWCASLAQTVRAPALKRGKNRFESITVQMVADEPDLAMTLADREFRRRLQGLGVDASSLRELASVDQAELFGGGA